MRGTEHNLLQFLNRSNRTPGEIEQAFKPAGISRALGARILEARPKGGFRHIEELLEVSGIGPARLARMLEVAASGGLARRVSPEFFASASTVYEEIEDVGDPRAIEGFSNMLRRLRDLDAGVKRRQAGSLLKPALGFNVAAASSRIALDDLDKISADLLEQLRDDGVSPDFGVAGIRYLRRQRKVESFFPGKRDWRRVRRQLRGMEAPLRKQFAKLRGAPVSSADMEILLDASVALAQAGTATMLATDSHLERVLESNLAADGTYSISGSTFVYYSPVGAKTVAELFDPQKIKLSQGILITSIIVQIIGLVAALVGIHFPKVDLTKLANRLGGRTRSRVVFKQIDKLFKILESAQKTVLEKLEAIVDFLSVLGNLGLLSDIVAQAFEDAAWWEIALLVGMFLAQLFLLGNPATGAAIAAKKAIAIGRGIFAILKKGLDLGRTLEAAAESG